MKKSRERDEALENIPLGKMGERMLITFGDGPRPDLEVISAALLGTRASLQRAILDARALRRYKCFVVPTYHMFILNCLYIIFLHSILISNSSYVTRVLYNFRHKKETQR